MTADSVTAEHGRWRWRASTPLRVAWSTSSGWTPAPTVPGRLILVLHHVVVDGVSLRLLAEDLAAAGRRRRRAADHTGQGRHPASGSGPTQLRAATDGGTSPTTRTTGCAWPCAADQIPLIGSRPLDPAVDVVATEARLVVRLDADVTARLLGPVPNAIRGGVNDVLRGRARVGPGEVAGRRRLACCSNWRDTAAKPSTSARPATTSICRARVGWFTTLFPVRVDPGAADWDRAHGRRTRNSAPRSRAVKDQLRAVPRNGLSYGALRYLSGRSRPDLAVQPQVLFNYLGRFTGAGDAPWTLAEDAVAEDRDPRMPLPRAIEVNAITVETDGGPRLEATFSWPSGVLDPRRRSRALAPVGRRARPPSRVSAR